MELSTVEIPRAGAREKVAAYMRAARDSKDPREKREYEEIARAYRIAARDEVPLIALTETIAAGGTVTRTLVQGKGGANERREHYTLPALAVCKATAAFVYTLGVQQDGSIEFIDSLLRRRDYLSGRIRLDAGLEVPDGFKFGDTMGERARSAWTAMVPIVPPEHRPARGLASRLILWDVEEWRWATVPAPPGDPALLRHVGGDIYAVEAVWDLTPLEQLVLSGRKMPELAW